MDELWPIVAGAVNGDRAVIHAGVRRERRQHLQKRAEFVDGKARLLDDAVQCAAFEIPAAMNRDRGSSAGVVWMYETAMTAR
jgi:hypothetical protein